MNVTAAAPLLLLDAQLAVFPILVIPHALMFLPAELAPQFKFALLLVLNQTSPEHAAPLPELFPVPPAHDHLATTFRYIFLFTNHLNYQSIVSKVYLKLKSHDLDKASISSCKYQKSTSLDE